MKKLGLSKKEIAEFVINDIEAIVATESFKSLEAECKNPIDMLRATQTFLIARCISDAIDKNNEVISNQVLSLLDPSSPDLK